MKKGKKKTKKKNKSSDHIWKLKQSLMTPQRDSSNYPHNYQVEDCKLCSQFTKKKQSRGEGLIYIINIRQIQGGHFSAHTHTHTHKKKQSRRQDLHQADNGRRALPRDKRKRTLERGGRTAPPCLHASPTLPACQL